MNAYAQSALLAAALLLFPSLALAEPGYTWETTVEVTAMGMTMPPQTVQACQPRQWREPPQEKNRESDCKVSDFKHVGNKMSWKMKCEGKHPVTGSGEITFQGESYYSGVVKMSIPEGESLMKMSGKRLTACEYTGKPPLASADPSAKLTAQQCKQGVDKLDAGLFLHGDVCNSYKQAFCDRLGSLDAVEQASRKGGTIGELAATCGKSAEGWCNQAAATDRVDFVSRHCPAQKAELLVKHCEGRDATAQGAGKYGAFCSGYQGKAEHPARQGTVQEVAPLEESAGAEAPAAPADAANKALDAIGDTAKKLKGLFRF
ncbi:MAG: DUF3617 family protein [Sulfuricella sp.]|nr:DUF3617 family protein [Sulfuricella sp.]